MIRFIESGDQWEVEDNDSYVGRIEKGGSDYYEFFHENILPCFSAFQLSLICRFLDKVNR